MAKTKTLPPAPTITGVAVSYDYRFGVLVLELGGPWEGAAKVMFRLDQLLKCAGVQPHELGAFLGNGRKIAPEEFEPDIEPARQRTIRETDLAGKTVLDLAGYDGSLAKVALECGAASAKVVDSEQWRIYGWPEPKPIPGVEFIKADLYEWQEPADVVIWYNCLYHVIDPMRALQHVRMLTKGQMLLCTLFRYHEGPWMYVYEPRECNNSDPSVYFGPSLDALERMLVLTGWTFERTGIALDRVVYRCTPIPDFVDAETVEVRRVSSAAPR